MESSVHTPNQIKSNQVKLEPLQHVARVYERLSCFLNKYVILVLSDSTKVEGYLSSIDLIHGILYLTHFKGIRAFKMNFLSEICENAWLPNQTSDFLQARYQGVIYSREFLESGVAFVLSRINFQFVPVKDSFDEEYVPHFILSNRKLLKFWYRRHWLFTRFDEGIMLDAESFYSVTVEKVAEHIARRFATTSSVIDLFSGCGGNTIQFSRFSRSVLAVEMDESKLLMLKNNANIYNVQNIVLVNANVLDIIKEFHGLKQSDLSKFSRIFLSPPWGGPGYEKHVVFDLKAFTITDKNRLEKTSLFELITSVLKLRLCTAVLLPRKTNIDQLKEISRLQEASLLELEYHMVNNKTNTLCAYFWFNN